MGTLAEHVFLDLLMTWLRDIQLKRFGGGEMLQSSENIQK